MDSETELARVSKVLTADQSRAQSFSGSLSAVGRLETRGDNGISLNISLNFLIGCLQKNNQSKKSKNIQRNSFIPESLQATNRRQKSLNTLGSTVTADPLTEPTFPFYSWLRRLFSRLRLRVIFKVTQSPIIWNHNWKLAITSSKTEILNIVFLKF